MTTIAIIAIASGIGFALGALTDHFFGPKAAVATLNAAGQAALGTVVADVEAAAAQAAVKV